MRRRGRNRSLRGRRGFKDKIVVRKHKEKEIAVGDPSAAMAEDGRAPLPEGSMRELVNARMVTGFVARGDRGGFVIEASLGTKPSRVAILCSSRGGPRVFASLGTVAVLLQKFGFTQFIVDAAKYVPGRVRAPRPDRSRAMKAMGSVSQTEASMPAPKQA